jgi:hypothetical protein
MTVNAFTKFDQSPITDNAEKIKQLEDKFVGSFCDETVFNGVDAIGKLDQLYTIQNVGDYFEFTATFLSGSASFRDNVGVFGTLTSTANNVVGMLSNTVFAVRAADSTWVQWELSALSFDRKQRNTYRVDVTTSGNITFSLNGVVVSEQAANLPILLEDIANTYPGELAIFSIKDISIVSSTGSFIADDLALSTAILTNTTQDQSIVNPTEQVGHDVLYVDQQTDVFSIKVPASRDKSYIEYTFVHQINAAINADNWRMREMYTTDELFARDIQITTSGENEVAIKELGAADFMGGNNHGDHELIAAHVLIDGVERDLTDLGSYEAQRIEFFQQSVLYQVGTNKAVQAAEFWQHWSWSAVTKKVTLRQHIRWDISMTLVDTYLTMLSIKRDDGAGKQITDVGLRSPKFEKEDIALAGHVNSLTQADQVYVYSKDTGISAMVRILSGWDLPGRQFNIDNSASFNKLYFDFTGVSYVTVVGETFTMESEFLIDRS